MQEYEFDSNIKEFPKTYGIYAIKGIYNNFHLVGQTTRRFSTRWREHRYDLEHDKHENPYLQNAFNKHGAANFRFVLLETCNKNELNKKEIYWIEKMKSMKDQNGWNMREGGSFGQYGSTLRKRVSEGIRNSKKSQDSRRRTRKEITLISPQGEVVKFIGIREFCIKFNLNAGSIWRLQSGKMSHHKGWKNLK